MSRNRVLLFWQGHGARLPTRAIQHAYLIYPSHYQETQHDQGFITRCRLTATIEYVFLQQMVVRDSWRRSSRHRRDHPPAVGAASAGWNAGWHGVVQQFAA